MIRPVAVAILCSCAASAAWGQPALEQFENQLGSTPAAETAIDLENIGYLGVLADDQDENGRGVRVTDVVSGGPADRAGLRIRDLIVDIDGQGVATMNDFANVMQQAKPEQRVSFRVVRNERPYEVIVTLGKRPAPSDRKFPLFGQPQSPAPGGGDGPMLLPEPANQKRLLGVRTVPLTDYARQFFQLPVSHGAMVTAIAPGSPAEQAGLPLDAVIVAANDQPVKSPDELADRVAAVGAGAEIELSFYSRGALDKRRVALREFTPTPDRLPDSVKELPQEDPPTAPDDGEGNAELREQLRRMELRLRRLEAMIERMLPPPGFAPGAPPGNDT